MTREYAGVVRPEGRRKPERSGNPRGGDDSELLRLKDTQYRGLNNYLYLFWGVPYYSCGRMGPKTLLKL